MKSNIRQIVITGFMNEIVAAFSIQAFSSIYANSKIHTIALYPTVKDKKGQVWNEIWKNGI